MRIENLIFATKKIALRQWVELFSTHWRNKKAKPIKFKHFYKKPLTSLFLHFSKSKQEMEIQNTLFVVECTRAEILPRAKIASAKFSIKNMSWNLPFMLYLWVRFIVYSLRFILDNHDVKLLCSLNESFLCKYSEFVFLGLFD